MIFEDLWNRALTQELGTDDTSALFTDTRRKQAVNDAQAEFADLTECLQRDSTITITGGTAEYDLLSTTVLPGGDFSRLASRGVEFTYTDASSVVQILTGDDLIRRDIDWLNRYQQGWRTSTVSSGIQTPNVYYLRADGGSLYLGFTPVPSTGSSASAEARVTYLAQPSTMSSSGDEPFTVSGSVRTDLRPYHQGLVHYAAHQLEKLRRDDEQANLQLQKFMGYVARYLKAKRIRSGQTLSFAKTYFKRAEDVEDPRT